MGLREDLLAAQAKLNAKSGNQPVTGAKPATLPTEKPTGTSLGSEAVNNLVKAIGDKDASKFMLQNRQAFCLLNGRKIPGAISNGSSHESNEIKKLKGMVVKYGEDFNKTLNYKKFKYNVENFQTTYFKDYSINNNHLITYADYLVSLLPVLLLVFFIAIKKRIPVSKASESKVPNNNKQYQFNVSSALIKNLINSFLIALTVVLCMNLSLTSEIKKQCVNNYLYTLTDKPEDISVSMNSYFNHSSKVETQLFATTKYDHVQDWKGIKFHNASSVKINHIIIMGLLIMNDYTAILMLWLFVLLSFQLRQFIIKKVSIKVT
jgi:hypothetical protein